MTTQNTSITGPILVTGATGMQGGVVAAALLKAGKTVRALVRNPNSDEAKALQAAGAQLAVGDMLNRSSLDAALVGVESVFSMQPSPQSEDDTTEVDSGRNLVDAAFEAGVRMFVQTSVARAGDQDNFADRSSGKWYPNYWNSKSAVIDMVVNRGFESYTILKPALIMENYAETKSPWMYPELITEGRIATATKLATKLDLIAPEDIGAFALAAFENPQKFNGAHIDLAAVSLDSEEIAAALTRGTGHTVVAEYISPGDLLKQGVHPLYIESHEWNNVEGYKVDIPTLAKWGIPLKSFDEWIVENKDRIKIGSAK